MDAHLVDRVGLDSRVDKISDEFALQILYGSFSCLWHRAITSVTYLQEELLRTDLKCLFAGSFEVLVIKD